MQYSASSSNPYYSQTFHNEISFGRRLSLHDLISMTLMNGSGLLDEVVGFIGLL